MRLEVLVILKQDGKEFDRTEWYFIGTTAKDIGSVAGAINYQCYNEGMTNIENERIYT